MERNVWRKSTRSSVEGQCVEVMITATEVLLRDTKDRGTPAHRFTHSEWTAFAEGVRHGEFDLH